MANMGFMGWLGAQLGSSSHTNKKLCSLYEPGQGPWEALESIQKMS